MQQQHLQKNQPRGPQATSTARAAIGLCCRRGLSDVGMEGGRKRKRGASASAHSRADESAEDIRSESAPSHAADLSPGASPEPKVPTKNGGRPPGRPRGRTRGQQHLDPTRMKAAHREEERDSQARLAAMVRDSISIARNVLRVSVSFSSSRRGSKRDAQRFALHATLPPHVLNKRNPQHR